VHRVIDALLRLLDHCIDRSRVKRVLRVVNYRSYKLGVC
jgi:hypothetical protein